MQVSSQIITLNKLYPFTISRGTRSESQNVIVTVDDGANRGVGEFDATIIGDSPSENLDVYLEQLKQFVNQYDLANMSIHDIWRQACLDKLPARVLAALDMALWDLLGKTCGRPCYQLFGLSPRSVPTSMTIGITPLDQIPERVNQLLGRFPLKYLKIKLGSRHGVEADKAAFLAIKNAALPYQVGLRVDANGGWDLANAKEMMRWLADQGVDYVEQPLNQACDGQLAELYIDRPLPLFVDESCCTSEDIPRLAPHVDGVNLKLMKAGGLTEAIRMVATARAHGLKTMIGCMSESSIAISAAASIGALFDYIDLDSHLNLNPDPAKGADLIDGAIIPNAKPGHGASLC